MGIVGVVVSGAEWETIPPVIRAFLTLTSEMGRLEQAGMANRTDGTLASVLRKDLESKHLLMTSDLHQRLLNRRVSEKGSSCSAGSE
jgi:hypothetical protein